MKTTGRLLLLFAMGAAVLVVFVLLVSAYRQGKQPIFQNGPKLIIALQAFARDQAARGGQLSSEVNLQDLVAGGYLTKNDVRAFQGIDVAFFAAYDDRTPQSIMARARTKDGQMICLMGDGSVQQFAPSRYEKLRTNL